MRASHRGILAESLVLAAWVPPAMMADNYPAPYVASGSTIESLNYYWNAFDRAGTSTYFQTKIVASSSLTSYLQLNFLFAA